MTRRCCRRARGLVAPAPAAAETFNVNTTADNAAATCLTTCSLRGALIAFRRAEARTWNLPAGTYNLLQARAGRFPVPNKRYRGRGRLRPHLHRGRRRELQGDALRRRPARRDRERNDRRRRRARQKLTEGGNLFLDSGANLLLDHVRITRGVALQGGGISMVGGEDGQLEIRHSLIDTNEDSRQSANPRRAAAASWVRSSTRPRHCASPTHDRVQQGAVRRRPRRPRPRPARRRLQRVTVATTPRAPPRRRHLHRRRRRKRSRSGRRSSLATRATSGSPRLR